MLDLKEKQEARIQRDLDDARFGMICSNEDTFKRYIFEQLDKVRKETAKMVCDEKMKKCKRTIFGIKHNYGKWKTVTGQILYNYGELSGNIIIQERECNNCGYIKRQIQKVGS